MATPSDESPFVPPELRARGTRGALQEIDVAEIMAIRLDHATDLRQSKTPRQSKSEFDKGRSDLRENLFALYLRLNGYFLTTGFIVHARKRNKTEIDALAVRFPHHREPETEIGPDPVLGTSDSLLDFLVCEVKGGTRIANFNRPFREDPEAIASVLNRFGAFSEGELKDLVQQTENALSPERIRTSRDYPTIDIPRLNSRIRFVLVAPDQKRSKAKKQRPYIYGDDMILYIWQHFRPEAQRQRSDLGYDWNLWGQYTKLVRYFKDRRRVQPGDIDSIYRHFGLSGPDAERHPESANPHAQQHCVRSFFRVLP